MSFFLLLPFLNISRRFPLKHLHIEKRYIIRRQGIWKYKNLPDGLNCAATLRGGVAAQLEF